jgi:hypothetical protein
VTADDRVELANDETVGVVPAALPGHVGVTGPGGRPELDDGAKGATAHVVLNIPLMKIIPVKSHPTKIQSVALLAVIPNRKFDAYLRALVVRGQLGKPGHIDAARVHLPP